METCSGCEHWVKVTHWGMCRAIVNVEDTVALQNPDDATAVIVTSAKTNAKLPTALSTHGEFGCVMWKEREIPYE